MTLDIQCFAVRNGVARLVGKRVTSALDRRNTSVVWSKWNRTALAPLAPLRARLGKIMTHALPSVLVHSYRLCTLLRLLHRPRRMKMLVHWQSQELLDVKPPPILLWHCPSAFWWWSQF